MSTELGVEGGTGLEERPTRSRSNDLEGFLAQYSG